MTLDSDHPRRDTSVAERDTIVTEPLRSLSAVLADDHYVDRLAAGRLPAADHLTVLLYVWCAHIRGGTR